MGYFRHATLVALLAATCVGASAQEQPSFSVDVRLVRMLVTVRDEYGKPVAGLKPEDFTITDNNAAQQITLFEPQSSQPLSVALLVDTSRSTASDRRYEFDGARTFLNALIKDGNPEDACALYGFNTDVTRYTDYSRNISKIQGRLGRLKSEGATSLYDAVYLAAHDLQLRPGRHVLVVVSDGGDTASRVKFQEALEALHGSDAVLYALLVMPITNDSGRNIGGENALTEFAQWTGGKIFFPAGIKAVEAAFAEILRDLRTEYLIGYYPKNLPPTREPFHRVSVKVHRPRVSVSARNGYFSDDVEPVTPAAPPQRPTRRDH